MDEIDADLDKGITRGSLDLEFLVGFCRTPHEIRSNPPRHYRIVSNFDGFRIGSDLTI